jgi:hypothetical protein
VIEQPIINEAEGSEDEYVMINNKMLDSPTDGIALEDLSKDSEYPCMKEDYYININESTMDKHILAKPKENYFI